MGLGYAVGIAATYQVTDGSGGRWEARKLINKVRPEQWMRQQTGHGTKGTREYDNAAGARSGTSVLVARRHRYTGEVSYFRCWAPGDVSLGTPVEVICRRWRIEETFQLAKGFTGLDQAQVTCWNSWMSWSLFSIIAAAVLALTTAAVHEATDKRPELVARPAPNSSVSCESSCCHHPSATVSTSCTGPPGTASTKPSRQPATSNDHRHDQP